MYEGRLKFFIFFFLFFLSISILRLGNLQVLHCQETREKIATTGVRSPQILPTVRGAITDRYGRNLAVDVPEFEICIRYRLARLKDERFWRANSLITAEDKSITVEQALNYWQNRLKPEIEMLDEILQSTVKYSGKSEQDIIGEIELINDKMWRLRRYFAWKRNFPKSESIADFDNLDENKKLVMEGYINDLWEMKNQWFPIADIRDDNIYDAQSALGNNPEIDVTTRARRKYNYGSCASQIIGWVNPSKPDRELFDGNELISYQEDEVAGFYGTERVCEPFLRGKRGKLVYTNRDAPAEQKERQFGDNIRLTIDIQLQRMIEEMLVDPQINKNSNKVCNAVVIDVATGDILAAVSTPQFDLNLARKEYAELVKNKLSPLQNKAFEKLYPPGSTVKPIILVAGLEEHAITESQTISCSLPADENWPRCWLQRAYGCHDDQFIDEGGNNGRNAIRGSCNIYFTKLAHRIDAKALQEHLYSVGLGHDELCPIDFSLIYDKVESEPSDNRNLAEQRGIIWSGFHNPQSERFEDLPPLSDSEKRWFGMGQGNLRVTVLQVANIYATIARGGIFKNPRIYANISQDNEGADLGWSPVTLRNVREGIWMVVNKYHGSAYNQFKGFELFDKGIRISGKTGSTQGPENAWFAGFAESENRVISIAVIVEGGQSGTQDGAPLGREIFKIVDECGYFD